MLRIINYNCHTLIQRFHAQLSNTLSIPSILLKHIFPLVKQWHGGYRQENSDHKSLTSKILFWSQKQTQMSNPVDNSFHNKGDLCPLEFSRHYTAPTAVIPLFLVFFVLKQFYILFFFQIIDFRQYLNKMLVNKSSEYLNSFLTC